MITYIIVAVVCVLVGCAAGIVIAECMEHAPFADEQGGE